MTIAHDPNQTERLCKEALAIFQHLPEDRQKALMEEQRKSVEESARRDAERRRLENRPEPNWIDRAAWIAREIREPARNSLGDVIEDRDPEGQSGPHLLWMLEELSARRVGSETKTCRWLGYAQALAIQYGILDLERAKQLNLRSKTEAQLIATQKAPPAPTQSMRAALQGLLDTYVSLHESGDAGNLGIDTDETVIAARVALNAFPARTPEPHLAVLVRRLLDDHDAKRDVNESVKAVRLALMEVVHPEPFQARCQKWLDVVTEGDATDLAERRARFMEEAMELVQSLGMGLGEAIQLAAYVWERPNGVPSQEYGGAYTTLAVLAQFTKHDLAACGETELARCWDPAVIEKIRGKRSRRHGRGPLPGTTAPEADLVPAQPAAEFGGPIPVLKGTVADPFFNRPVNSVEPGQPIPDTFYSGCGDRVGPR